MSAPLLKPKEVTLSDMDGNAHVFIISRVPAIPARELVSQYPLTAAPKIGDYPRNEALMLKLLSYVAVPRPEGEPLRLTTAALVDNHVPDWELLARLEMAMMEYNVSFFGNGRASNFLDGIAQQAQQWITQTLIPSLQASLPKGKPPSQS